jgi:hypothetical protein
MSIELLRKRLAADRASFIEPCLPSPAVKQEAEKDWGKQQLARHSNSISEPPVLSRTDPWPQVCDFLGSKFQEVLP